MTGRLPRTMYLRGVSAHAFARVWEQLISLAALALLAARYGDNHSTLGALLVSLAIVRFVARGLTTGLIARLHCAAPASLGPGSVAYWPLLQVAFIVPFTAGALLAAAFVFVLPTFEWTSLITAPTLDVLAVVAWGLPFSIIGWVAAGHHHAQERHFYSIACASLMPRTFEVVLIAACVALQLPASLLPWMYVIAALVAAFVSACTLPAALFEARPSFSSIDMKYTVSATATQLPNAAADPLYTMLVSAFSGPESVPVFVLAARIASVAALFHHLLVAPYIPRITRLYASNDVAAITNEYRAIQSFSVLPGLVLLTSLVALEPLIGQMLPGYEKLGHLAALLALAQVVNIASGPSGRTLLYLRHAGIAAVLGVVKTAVPCIVALALPTPLALWKVPLAMVVGAWIQHGVSLYVVTHRCNVKPLLWPPMPIGVCCTVVVTGACAGWVGEVTAVSVLGSLSVLALMHAGSAFHRLGAPIAANGRKGDHSTDAYMHTRQ